MNYCYKLVSQQRYSGYAMLCSDFVLYFLCLHHYIKRWKLETTLWFSIHLTEFSWKCTPKILLYNVVTFTNEILSSLFSRQVSSNDYSVIENKVKGIVKEKQPFERLEMTKEDLLKMFEVKIYRDISLPLW